jgi:RNA polymerase sigma-70 factor (ECF subfamily)
MSVLLRSSRGFHSSHSYDDARFERSSGLPREKFLWHLFFMTAGASDESFRTLFEPHRRPITLHCYRMLGSLQDAEEIVQETLLRAWQRRDEAKSTSTLRPWLHKIATNACLDHLLKARRRRALPHLVASAQSSPALRLGPPSDERFWVEPAPDTLFEVEDDTDLRPDERVPLRESVGLAFITALQFLSPKQRAALLLVDVLGWKPDETAALLETSLFSVNSLLQRARNSIETRRDAAAPPEVSSSDAALLRRFITTWESGDVDAFTALLAHDALFSMPPQPEWFAGREAIAGFFAAVWSAQPAQRRLLQISANGGPAIAAYRRLTPNAPYEPNGISLITIREGRVSQLTRFGAPALFSLFGLPAQLPSE